MIIQVPTSKIMDKKLWYINVYTIYMIYKLYTYIIYVYTHMIEFYFFIKKNENLAKEQRGACVCNFSTLGRPRGRRITSLRLTSATYWSCLDKPTKQTQIQEKRHCVFFKEMGGHGYYPSKWNKPGSQRRAWQILFLK